MSETKREHEIRTVGDFLTVPEDKRDACLADFKMWLGFMELAITLGEMAGGGVTPDTGAFRWIDDGKHDAHVTFHITNEPKREAR